MSDEKAPSAEEIWRQWFSYMNRPRSVTQPALSVADQIAFLEVAQPIITAAEQAARDEAERECINVCRYCRRGATVENHPDFGWWHTVESLETCNAGAFINGRQCMVGLIHERRHQRTQEPRE